MKIIALTLWRVPLTSRVTYHMADGKTCDTVDSMVLRIDTDAGIHGWGEVCPIPHYLPAYAGGVAPALEECRTVLLGADPLGPERILNKLDAWLPGHAYLKSVVDIALWDITARAADLPLHALLGGRRQDTLPLYHSISCLPPDEMVSIAREAVGEGVEQIQVKLGADSNWQIDVERLVKVREAVPESTLVYGDWNCGATRLEATRVARAVAHLDIMLEQPCRRIEECAAVRASSGLAMKLDENVHDIDSLLQANALGCMDAVAIKLSKFGGISACRRARDLCEHLGVRMCVEDTWGSDVTTAALLHLAAATDPKLLLNTCDLSGYVTPRLDSSAPTRDKGRIAPPVGPGLGVDPSRSLSVRPILALD